MSDNYDEEYWLQSGQGSPPSDFVRTTSLVPVVETDWASDIIDTAWLDELPSTSTSMGNFF